MCRSQVEGGQRCAAGTRPKFEAKGTALDAAKASGDPGRVIAALKEWEQAAAEYASTDEGANLMRERAEAAERNRQWDEAAMYTSIARRGLGIREANQAAADAMLQHRTSGWVSKSRGAAKGLATKLLRNHRADGTNDEHCSTSNATDASPLGPTGWVSNSFGDAFTLNAADGGKARVWMDGELPGWSVAIWRADGDYDERGFTGTADEAKKFAADLLGPSGWVSDPRGDNFTLDTPDGRARISYDDERPGYWYVTVDCADGDYDERGFEGTAEEAQEFAADLLKNH